MVKELSIKFGENFIYEVVEIPDVVKWHLEVNECCDYETIIEDSRRL